MAAKEYPLALVIKAVDKATAPLRAINQRIAAATAPVRRLNNSFRALAGEAGIPRLGKAIGSVISSAVSLGRTLALVTSGAAYGLYRVVRGAADAGDKLAEMAQRVGLSVDAYAQLQFAAAQADVEQEAFNGAMDQFNKRLGMAKAGTGELLSFLQKVAPALAQQVKGAKSTEDAIFLLAGAFEKVTDPGKRAALAAAAFGRSGLQMGQFLGQGEKGVRAFMERFAELAGSQKEFAENAGAVDNAAREAEVAFLGLRNAAAGALFPALSDIARAVADLLSKNRDGIARWARETGAAIQAWVKGGGLERLTASLSTLKWVLAGVVAIMAGSALSSIASFAAAIWNLGAAALPLLVRGFMLAIPLLWKGVAALMAMNLANPLFWIVAIGAALAGAAYLVWKHWEPIKQFFLDLWEKVKAIGSWFGGKFGISSGPAIGASGSAPALGSAHGGNAHVQVDFANVPKGVRVSTDPQSTADVDLGLGYSMAPSH